LRRRLFFHAAQVPFSLFKQNWYQSLRRQAERRRSSTTLSSVESSCAVAANWHTGPQVDHVTPPDLSSTSQVTTTAELHACLRAASLLRMSGGVALVMKASSASGFL
jgi:hypothetical protein